MEKTLWLHRVLEPYGQKPYARHRVPKPYGVKPYAIGFSFSALSLCFGFSSEQWRLKNPITPKSVEEPNRRVFYRCPAGQAFFDAQSKGTPKEQMVIFIFRSQSAMANPAAGRLGNLTKRGCLFPSGQIVEDVGSKK